MKSYWKLLLGIIFDVGVVVVDLVGWSDVVNADLVEYVCVVVLIIWCIVFGLVDGYIGCEDIDVDIGDVMVNN